MIRKSRALRYQGLMEGEMTKMRWVYKVFVVFELAVVLIGVQAAQTASTPKRLGSATKGSSVSGRVFAIARGGDLMPARLAHVYLMGRTQNGKHESAVGVFLDRQIAGLENLNQERRKRLANHKTSSQEEDCQEDLLIIQDSVQASLRWATENKMYQQFQGTDTDEEGMFRFSALPIEFYSIAVIGRAGPNDAYWKADVLVGPAQEVKLKLGSPEKACLSLP
jgi:hypothetical protein